MLVKCSECQEMQAWKAQGGSPLRATACDKCGLPALHKLTPKEERARRQAFIDTLPPRAPVVVARQAKSPRARNRFVCDLAARLLVARGAPSSPDYMRIYVTLSYEGATALAHLLAKGGYLE